MAKTCPFRGTECEKASCMAWVKLPNINPETQLPEGPQGYCNICKLG